MHNLKFDYQSPGMCAHYSLIHALTLLGITITEKDAIRLTGVSRSKAEDTGTNEDKLIKAIRKAKCKPHPHTCHSQKKAKAHIDAFLKKGMPVIISTDNEYHWAVLAGKYQDQYYWIDSADRKLIGHWNWHDIAEWMEYHESEYYFIGVESKDMSHSIVKRFHQLYPLLKLKQYKSVIRWLFDGIRK